MEQNEKNHSESAKARHLFSLTKSYENTIDTKLTSFAYFLNKEKLFHADDSFIIKCIQSALNCTFNSLNEVISIHLVKKLKHKLDENEVKIIIYEEKDLSWKENLYHLF